MVHEHDGGDAAVAGVGEVAERLGVRAGSPTRWMRTPCWSDQTNGGCLGARGQAEHRAGGGRAPGGRRPPSAPDAPARRRRRRRSAGAGRRRRSARRPCRAGRRRRPGRGRLRRSSPSSSSSASSPWIAISRRPSRSVDAGVLRAAPAGGGRRPGPSGRRTARARRRSASPRCRGRVPRTRPPGRSGRRRRSRCAAAPASAASSRSASSSVRSVCACGEAGQLDRAWRRWRSGGGRRAAPRRCRGWTARSSSATAVVPVRSSTSCSPCQARGRRRRSRPLAGEQRLRERRAVVGRVRLGADHRDRAVVAAGAQRLGAALRGEAGADEDDPHAFAPFMRRAPGGARASCAGARRAAPPPGRRWRA